MFGGVVMQLELLAPGGLWSANSYGRMISLHGLAPLAIGAAAFAGVAGYLAVIRLVGATRFPLPAVAWVGVGLWAIGMIAMTISAMTPGVDSGWTFYTPHSASQPSSASIVSRVGPIALAGSGLVYALHLGAIVGANRRGVTPLRLVLAIAVVVAIAVAAIAEVREAFAVISLDPITAATACVAVTLATIALAGDASGSRGAIAVVAILFAIAWAFAPVQLVSGVCLLGLWIALAVLGGFGRSEVAFVVFGCGAAIVMRGIGVAVPIDMDVHLFDTHFMVGAMHLFAATIGFAALGALHTWRPVARVPNPVLVWSGACMCSAGTVVHAYASMRVGASGMPRRYWDYDPEFTAGHWVSGLGTVVILVGVVLLAIAWLIGRRESRPARESSGRRGPLDA